MANRAGQAARSFVGLIAVVLLLAGCSGIDTAASAPTVDPDSAATGGMTPSDGSAEPASSTTASATDSGPDSTTPATTSLTTAPTSSADSSGPPPTTESVTTGTATPAPSVTAPSTVPPAHSTALQRVRRAQIPAHLLPGYNDQWVWQGYGEGPGPLPPRQSSVCLQSSLTAIGAVKEYHTSFSGPAATDSAAFQMTAVFPDEQTARTATQVLLAWHRQCRDYAGRSWDHVKVSHLSTVTTAGVEATSWLTMYKPVPRQPRAAWLDEMGFVVRGDAMTVVVMLTLGEDYNYPAGHTPVAEALAVAAPRLASPR